MDSVRADVWLWAVRLYKTRSLAAAACRKGQVRLQGAPIKPARNLRAGDELEVQRGFLEARYRVRSLLVHRVGAKSVPDHVEDLTTEEEREKARQLAALNQHPPVPPGTKGRPTKKDRRQMEEWTGGEDLPIPPAEIEELWKRAVR